MISVRVGGLYRYHSKQFPTLGLWRHKLMWMKGTKKRPGKAYTQYIHAGQVKDNETFVVLNINHLGEPLILTSGEQIGLIYFSHVKMKEVSSTEIRVKV